MFLEMTILQFDSLFLKVFACTFGSMGCVPHETTSIQQAFQYTLPFVLRHSSEISFQNYLSLQSHTHFLIRQITTLTFLLTLMAVSIIYLILLCGRSVLANFTCRFTFFTLIDLTFESYLSLNHPLPSHQEENQLRKKDCD